MTELESRTGEVLERYGIDLRARPVGWRRAVLRQANTVWKRALRRWAKRLAGREFRRGQRQIVAEYDGQWRKKAFERYAPAPLQGSGAPWIWRHHRFHLTNEAGAAVRIVYLEHALRQLGPATVLEVGCGNGINLHLLAGAFPEVTFTGVEMSERGCAAARSIAGSAVLPPVLQAFAPFRIVEPGAVRGVRVVRGSGAALPFPDRSFDVVMTSLALEQMEQIRDRALSELARVSAGYVVMLEPFAEVNGGGLRRAYVKAYDYFEGTISELHRYGLEVVSVLTDMPHKAWLGTALVIARRTG